MRRGQHIWARLTAVYHARSKGCDRIRSAVAIPTRTRGDRTATTHHIREDRTSQMLGDRDGAGENGIAALGFSSRRHLSSFTADKLIAREVRRQMRGS